MQRTLSWGRREILGKIIDKNSAVSLSLENIVERAPKSLEIALKKLEMIGYDVKNYFAKDVILKFQLDYGIITDKNSAGAGTYGPKTTTKLAQIFKEKQQNNTLKNVSLNPVEPLENIVIFNESTPLSEVEARELSQNMQITPIGETSETVKNLQKFLKKMNYYTEETHGIMTLQTLGSLRKYQSDKNITQTGRTDVRTQQFIKQDLMK